MENHTRAGGATSASNSFATETMAARSPTNSWQRLQAATCALAASGSGARPSCSTTISTSLHNMILHSAGAGAGCLPVRLLSNRFGAQIPDVLPLSRSHTLNCTHCNSIIMRRMGFCRMALLPCLLAYLFLEQVPQPSTRFMQLRLRISHRASHDVRDLVVLVALDVMKHKHRPVAR